MRDMLEKLKSELHTEIFEELHKETDRIISAIQPSTGIGSRTFSEAEATNEAVAADNETAGNSSKKPKLEEEKPQEEQEEEPAAYIS